MANENHPALTHSVCPKKCGLNEAIVLNSECLSCDCGWPDIVRGIDEEEEDYEDFIIKKFNELL